MGRSPVVAAVLLSACPQWAIALECPSAPEQVSKDWDVEVSAAVARIGPVKGGEFNTKTKKVTQDLLGKLPDAGRIYLEQMMFSAYCSALRDDRTRSEAEKEQRLRVYIAEVRKTIDDWKRNGIVPPPRPLPGREILSRTGYPRDIGDFSPPSNQEKCVRGEDGSLSVRVGKRAGPPGDFGGCCAEIEAVPPVLVQRGEKLAVDLTLGSADRVDVKLESDQAGQLPRTTMWLLRNVQQQSGESHREAVLLWEGGAANVNALTISRLCFAVFGETGPARNTLSVRSARLRP